MSTDAQTVTVSLFRFDSLYERHWALWQMLLGKPKLKRLPGVQFVKMVGAGSREGFFPIPDTSVEGVLCAWPSLEHARAQVRGSAVFEAFRRHATESATLYLQTTRVWGRWAGGEPFRPSADKALVAPIVALTRATIKPRHALSFWRKTPAIRAEIPEQERLLFKIGLAEIPWVNQITFTIWDDAEAMRAFAYRPGGPHTSAVEAVRKQGWFSEELYARFRVADVDGTWSRAPRLWSRIRQRRCEGRQRQPTSFAPVSIARLDRERTSMTTTKSTVSIASSSTKLLRRIRA